MKIFKLMLVALVATLGFTACDNEPEHIYDDHSADLVGTWSCLTENYAEVIIINADGSAVSYGVEDGEYWENVRGTVTVKENKITMIFEDDDNLTGHFDIIPGQAFSLFEDTGERYTYQYCTNDLADEIIGMWVVVNGSDMTIETFDEDGSALLTGIIGEEMNLHSAANYKVVGDLFFYTRIIEDKSVTVAYRLTYSPQSTSFGDCMTWQSIKDISFTRLRVKEELNRESGKKYDYSSAYVSNAKGKDEDFTITENTFNIANIESGDFDVMFRSVLFCVELKANTITQNFCLNGVHSGFDTPITVEGNKVTLNMSATDPAYRNVVMYMFQDADDSQLHIYMPTSSVINYLANLEYVTLLSEGKIDPTNTAAIEKVYTDMDERIESINLSLVMKARK